MRQLALEDPRHSNPANTHNAEAAKLISSGLDFVRDCPCFHSVKLPLCYQRHLQLPNLPMNWEDTVLEGETISLF